ncbi:hypothetical protein LTR64_002786 [Lithohypha guttulata]|uniref:uncharacterized protein n=1 Tax=Lithohypha guttulata TaxID=1690604 RepID=UPI002DDF2F22|nr:hypothetical protein LTR51_000989 [Lithohypha guttulata]
MPNLRLFTTDDGNSNHNTSPAQSPAPNTLRKPDIPRTRTSLSMNDADAEQYDEHTALLSASDIIPRSRYNRSGANTPRQDRLSRINSFVGSLHSRKISRTGTWTQSYPASPLHTRTADLRTPRLHQSIMGSFISDDRMWYDQFTSTDWVHDSIADGHHVLRLRRLKGWRGRLHLLFDSMQGWILVLLVGILTAFIAYFIDISDAAVFDVKRGFCSDRAWLSHRQCCLGDTSCARWKTWSEIIKSSKVSTVWIDYIAFVAWCVALACLSCAVTLFSKTVVPSHIAATFDENLAARQHQRSGSSDDKDDQLPRPLTHPNPPPPSIYYSAAGSGVAEVKVILSGFVLHGYLGARTLFLKVIALILSVSSGMSLGKEGPYVHIATCIGNVACRLFNKYNENDGKRREVLSASASSGVAVAFGSPLGGVLFGLEEVSYYFPPKTLFRTFFCCIAAALGLKFLNPYGNGKIVLFEVRYVTDWAVFELMLFAMLGALGGALGALFIKASKLWATTFRRVPVIKKQPMLEVFLVALITGIVSFWNRYTRLPVAELLAELASPCSKGAIMGTGLCPAAEDIPGVIAYLSMAFVIKAALTVVTFGIKVPAGIYVPSMVVGGLMGRIVGHFIQWLVYRYPGSWIFGYCSNSTSGAIEQCITPGVYALVAAGATMCGVTRLTITLAVILFELTGSLDHVLPFSLGILFAKWTADAVEPLSIYDLLTDMNSYPFLDNKSSPVFDSELGDIVPRLRLDRTIDTTISPYVRANDLRIKLNQLQDAGELDGGLPILREKILIGLIPVPDLEFALDKLETPEEETMCLMSSQQSINSTHHGWSSFHHSFDPDAVSVDDEDASFHEPADLTPYIDPAPVALDVHSPMDLVYQCFVKLGLRYICAVSDGQYRGMVHKKSFVKYIKTCEERS